MTTAPREKSDALVFFGATGDLAFKKIFPALHAMARRGVLDVAVVGVARSGWNRERFVEHARASIEAHGEPDEPALFSIRQRAARAVMEPPVRGKHSDHTGGVAMGNDVRFRLGPEIAIAVGALIKKPGDELVGQPVELSVVRQDAGDVEAAWTIVDPLIAVPREAPIEYEPGSWGPVEANRLVADIGGWNSPR